MDIICKNIKVGILMVFMLLYSSSEGKLFGDHVCQTEIIEPRETVQWELKNRTIRTYKWCMSVPPRCSVYSIKVFNETKISVINVTKSIETCCDGFLEQNSYCISLCPNCKNGLCLKGNCICQNGWEGTNCDFRHILNSKEEIITTITTSVQSFSNTDLQHSVTTEFLTDQIYSKTTINDISDNDDNQQTLQEISKTTISTIAPVSTTFKTSTESSLETIIFTSNKETDLNLLNEDITNKTSPVPGDFFTENYSENTILPFSKDKNMNAIDEVISTSLKPILIDSFDEKSSSQEYDSDFTGQYDTVESREKLTVDTYTTEYRYLDTTATKPTVVSSTVPMEMTISNKENFKTVVVNRSYINSSNSKEDITQSTTKGLTEGMFEAPDYSGDYRELGGQSVEEDTVGSQHDLYNGNDINLAHSNTLGKETDSSGLTKNSEYKEETGTQTMIETTWNTAPILDQPNISRDDKYNSIFKDGSNDMLSEFVEERYQKRSSSKNYSPNSLQTTDDPDNSNLIYSVCAASATTLLILIVVIIVVALKNSRKKINDKRKKDVATVAVYTTSIFHSPLPDPPTFENPTYLSTGGNKNWKDSNEEAIEVQEFNVVFQKPIKNPKLECKQYLYDHPPSTGSYRASSDIDTLSQYNISNKSMSGIILEPLYDEIPSRDNLIEGINIHDLPNEKPNEDGSRNSRNYIDNNSLYVNTFGRTMF